MKLSFFVMYITKVSYLLKYLTNYNQLALTCYYHTFFYSYYNKLIKKVYLYTYVTRTKCFCTFFDDIIRESMPAAAFCTVLICYSNLL